MHDYKAIAESRNFIVLDRYTPDWKVAEGYQSESDLEREFIQDLVNQGYEAPQGLNTPEAVLANVRVQLQSLNDVAFSDGEWQRFVETWLDKPSDGIVEKTRKIHDDYVHDFVFDDGHIQNIYLLDKKNVARNKVQVIKQFEQTGSHSNRYDVTILVNGLPLVQVELKKRGVAIPRKRAHAAFDFPDGSLLLTEASTKKRAALHVLAGDEALAALDAGGLEIFRASEAEFRAALERERHTLKRSLTDPHLFAGIGNAYSDEILHRARLSPVQWSDRLDDDAHARLYAATREVLAEWTDRLRAETGDDFPEKVTAFRPEMAVHGRFREPCPVCATPVQRIVRAENEVDYCPTCQTGGRVLADRALSKLLGRDWPRTVEELERRRPGPTPSDRPRRPS